MNGISIVNFLQDGGTMDYSTSEAEADVSSSHQPHQPLRSIRSSPAQRLSGSPGLASSRAQRVSDTAVPVLPVSSGLPSPKLEETRFGSVSLDQIPFIDSARPSQLQQNNSHRVP